MLTLAILNGNDVLIDDKFPPCDYRCDGLSKEVSKCRTVLGLGTGWVIDTRITGCVPMSSVGSSSF